MRLGEKATLGLRPDELHLFDAQEGHNLARAETDGAPARRARRAGGGSDEAPDDDGPA